MLILTNGTGYCSEHIGGNQADAALLLSREISGDAMQRHAKARGIEGRQPLREQSGDHAGEHIAHAARGHAGMAGVIDVDLAIHIRHNGAMPFQRHHHPRLLRKLFGDALAIALHGFNRLRD